MSTQHKNKLFGTDGIRGTANIEPMTPATALAVAMAAAAEFLRGSHRHTVVIGKDTRLSGYMLEPALAAGFISMGLDVVMVGPQPTPAIAMLTRSLRADLGVMISASHNPYQDNGLKLFGPDGYKLSDELEQRIEATVLSGKPPAAAAPDKLGRAQRLEDAGGRYIEFVKSTFTKGVRLDGLKIVIDCANGAAYKCAPRVLWELGAEVIPIAVSPNGRNINDKCGAMYPQVMADATQRYNAHLGIALDGDADRVIISDEKGQIIDGDQLLAVIAKHKHRRGVLRGGAVVATVMSNLGLERYLQELDLRLIRTAVGDRYVVEAMRAENCSVGGEQSGHIILANYGTTGDGLVAALQILAVLKESGRSASEVLRAFTPVPQFLQSVRVPDPAAILQMTDIKTAIAEAEQELAGVGRLLVRKSGTEPLVRVMAEGDNAQQVKDVVERLSALIKKAA